MNAIRIHRRIDSETIHLPELRTMIGKRVEITVKEETPQTQDQGDLALLDAAAGKDLIDPAAIEELRAASMI